MKAAGNELGAHEAELKLNRHPMQPPSQHPSPPFPIPKHIKLLIPSLLGLVDQNLFLESFFYLNIFNNFGKKMLKIVLFCNFTTLRSMLIDF